MRERRSDHVTSSAESGGRSGRTSTAAAVLVSILASLIVAVTGPPLPAGAAADPEVSFVGLSPARLLDTRTAFSTVDGLFAGEGAIGPDGTLDLVVGGRGGVPVGAAAVALNVTVAAPTAASFLTLHPTGSARPTASNLNFPAGATVANMVVVGLGAGESVSIYNLAGSAHVVVDVLGWFPDAGIDSLVPARLMDTRTGRPTVDGSEAGGGAFGAGETRSIAVTGRGGVPASGVVAVALNVTVAGPTAAGFVTAHPTGTARAGTSNVNFVAGEVRPNMVIVPVGTGGEVSFYNATGSAHLVVDVLAYFDSTDDIGALAPVRLADTRVGRPTVDGLHSGYRALDTATVVNLQVGGRGGVPADAGAVVLNVTATASLDPGYFTAFPTGALRPVASNLNFLPAQTIANLVVVPLGNDGQVSFYNFSGPVHLVVDVMAWFPQPVTSAIELNSLTLRSGGLATHDYGSAAAAVIAAATAVYGAPTSDVSMSFPTLDPGGYYVNGSTAFAHPSGREVCFEQGRLCLWFGGVAAPLPFVGWSYGSTDIRWGPMLDGRLTDAHGVSLLTRAADAPGEISYAAGGCYSISSGTTATGISVVLESKGEWFLIPDGLGGATLNRPPETDVYVIGFDDGDAFFELEVDC